MAVISANYWFFSIKPESETHFKSMQSIYLVITEDFFDPDRFP